MYWAIHEVRAFLVAETPVVYPDYEERQFNIIEVELYMNVV